MIRLEINNCKMMLTEKHKKYLLYHILILFKAFKKQTKTIEKQGEKQKQLKIKKKNK